MPSSCPSANASKVPSLHRHKRDILNVAIFLSYKACDRDDGDGHDDGTSEVALRTPWLEGNGPNGGEARHTRRRPIGRKHGARRREVHRCVLTSSQSLWIGMKTAACAPHHPFLQKKARAHGEEGAPLRSPYPPTLLGSHAARLLHVRVPLTTSACCSACAVASSWGQQQDLNVAEGRPAQRQLKHEK